MKNQKENGLVINLPITIKSVIDAEFTTYSKNNLEKIYFLVWKINKEKDYQLHIGNHAEFFGLKRGEITKILNSLRRLLLIFNSESYSAGYKSNTYQVYKIFKLTTSDYQVFYYPSQNNLPMWVQKYIADGGTIRSSKHTNWVKRVIKKMDKESSMAALKEEIVILKSQLLEKDLLITQLRESQIKQDTELKNPNLENVNKPSQLRIISNAEIPQILECKKLGKSFRLVYDENVAITDELLNYLSLNISKITNFYEYRDYNALIIGDYLKIKNAVALSLKV
ncbi:hypothetical protein ACFOG5_09735 [Pedobacter fastidiosus]|uniref:DnaA N-terminal domain-containing protein n=1 Tax=Pedobacter fastidiosus TaxID=2765361 RepID=A0ABR7KY30_9SPHI|nr:hypothetical protein [Pedobacter fastidiosus]MBC6112986.1 hypothetical protein [Pedobacter fastidiosus]